MKTMYLSEDLKAKMVSDHNWIFDNTALVPRFKSPRMKLLAPLYSYEAGPNVEEVITEEYLLNLEIETLLAEKYLTMKNSFEKVALDILNQYRLHLNRKLAPPDILTVSFDVHFENL